MRLALLELKMAVVEIIQQFKLIPSETTQSHVSGITEGMLRIGIRILIRAISIPVRFDAESNGLIRYELEFSNHDRS